MLTTVEVSALNFEPVIESSPGVYTTDSDGWPSHLSLTQTSETNTFQILQDSTLLPGTEV